MADPRPPPVATVGYNMGAIALLVAAMGLAAAYIIDAASRSAKAGAREQGTATLSRTLSGRELSIPASWFRYNEQEPDGYSKQIELRIDLPLGARGKPVGVDVTLLPRSRVRPSASLLDGVYLHQFQAQQVWGPPGLVGKPLRPGEGFADETVWYDALAADPFVAKCSSPVATATAAQCLRTVYLGPGLAAIYAFPDSLLTNWREFDPLINAQLAQIGAL